MQQLGLSHSPKTESRLKELLWPDVNNTVAIRTVCHTGMWVSFVVGGLELVLSFFTGYVLGGFIIAAIFAGIGVGIRRYSRVLSLLGALLYIGANLATASFGVMTIIFSFLFITSIRASFAFHRLKKQAPLPNTVAGEQG